MVSVSCAMSEGLKEESRYLALLSGLQFVETPEDMKKLIPDCPGPRVDAGEDNTEIVVKTKLFGVDAKGEFNFHKGVLVSHGFEVFTANYQQAHRVFLEAVAILDRQANDLKLSTALPTALNGEDSSDGPEDEINIYVEGTNRNSYFQLRLDMRQDSILVRWGAQKASPLKEKPIEQTGTGRPATRPECPFGSIALATRSRRASAVPRPWVPFLCHVGRATGAAGLAKG